MSLPPAPFAAAASFVQSVDKLQHALSPSVLTSPDFSAKTVINMDANNKRKSSSGDSKYLPELLAEKDSLDSSFTHAMKLLGAEIERVQKGEPKKESETYLDLFTAKNVRVKERVLIPVKQYPRFNFVGKILGPQGSTIKRLQEDTGAKISVLGKGSMRDKNKEEELRKGGDPKYAHLAMELHVHIEVFAPIPDCYLRMAHAMDEVKKFLMPVDGIDEMHPDAFMDPGFLNGSQDMSGHGRGHGPPGRGRGGPPRGRGMPPRGAPRGGAPRGGPGRGAAARGAPAGRGGPPPSTPTRGAGASRSRPPAQAQRMTPATALSHQQHSVKTEAYGEYAYEEPYPEAAYEGYESYYSQPAPQPDTEYYDYGHGEAQETYESYKDDWEGAAWGGAGGKAPPARQGKSFREHPYVRY
ncbi:KH domain-containing, RNA-binding, signal transduction-associated protein 1a isoform X2 [Pimephales promelas]|uniref:KH domain-containing, RNA-binding, signal transduction-associated protein 1a isoform X2 n=1 Tax=Pimephales promelas TaxID=90988 RepID=UPI00195599E3|nr:KH domain-containing, RNA-binding, signal transduction-associated protein 1a isoform X2 [Pimephales promelas]XP_039527736.1 KH domain-containing, RNA-binding, signal transduction-associated protein 1a isoform X2 [Pimephales promelas]KAG1950541.1 KH domain containing, RNA binding, signal transduction associated 1a [Pimephales promelas]